MASKLLGKLKPGSSKDPVDADSKPAKEDKKAMELIAKWASKGKAKQFPEELKDYLQKHPPLQVRATATQAGLYDYALKFKRGNVVVLPSGDVTVQGTEYQTFKALLVPMVKRDDAGKAIQSFPRQQFTMLDLANPPQDRLIATPKLSGCSLVVGITDNNVFYLGHAQPPSSEGQRKTMGAELARYFKEANKDMVFDGVHVSRVKVFGADAEGYGVDAEATILGWVSDSKLFLAIRSSTAGLSRIVTLTSQEEKIVHQLHG